MSAREFIPDDPGFPVRWYGRFAVLELAAGQIFLTAPVLAGLLCAVLDEGAPGLIVVWAGPGARDSVGLDVLLRTAKRARGWGSWLRLIVPDPDIRRLVRLLTLNEAMPVHASVTGAVAATAAGR